MRTNHVGARLPSMFEVKTILVMNLAACLILAVSLSAAISTPVRQSRDGLWLWLASMVVQAVAYSLLLVSAASQLVFYHVIAHAVLATFLTLQAAALFQFFGRALNRWWHFLPAFLVAVLFGLAATSPNTLSIFAGVFFGIGYAVMALLASYLGAGMRSAGLRLIVVGYAFGSLAFLVRALPVIVLPDSSGGAQSTLGLLELGMFLSFGVLILTSVGFLVLQKDRAEDAANQLAVTDPLTGVFNRRTFLELAEKELARSRRADTPLALVMLDLDHFKSINDRHGHLAGDFVLKRFVEVTRFCLRQEDLFVRYGGEEFCVLLPNTTADEALALAERIRRAVESAAFIYRAGKDERAIPVTVSAGVAELDRARLEEIGGLVSRADEALYAAKRGGRNRSTAFLKAEYELAMLTRSQRLAVIQKIRQVADGIDRSSTGN
jgi:diguanylate cyclase (GGDEF)-like protein